MFRNDPAVGRTTKGRRSRTVPLSAVALAALRDHAARFRLAAPTSPWVFKHTRRTKDAGPGDRLRSITQGFASAARRTGIVGLHPHCLRHSFVTRKLAEGVPLALVSRYVGHSTFSMTQRYAHLLGEHLRMVVSPESATPGLKLTPFRGHAPFGGEGVHDAIDVSTGVSPADGGVGAGGAESEGLGPGV